MGMHKLYVPAAARTSPPPPTPCKLDGFLVRIGALRVELSRSDATEASVQKWETDWDGLSTAGAPALVDPTSGVVSRPLWFRLSSLCMRTVRAELIGHFKACMTESYLHIDARMADYIHTHP